MMKKRRIPVYAVSVAALGVATFAGVYLTRHSREAARLPLATSTPVNQRSVSPPAKGPGPQLPDQTLRDFPASSSDETEHAPSIHLDSNQILATVNEVPIRLQHLLPLGPETKETWLTSEELDSRLKRAVDVEMIFQAARSEGVVLTEPQQMRVNGIGDDSKAELEHYQKFGMAWSSAFPEQDEFEKRLLTAQLLEQNLVSKKSTVGPSADPDTQSRYEKARLELLAQLQAKATITGLTASR